MLASVQDSKTYMKRTRLFLITLCLPAVFLCTACRHNHITFVDFTDPDNAKNLKFRVISQHETDLSQGLPYNCYMPDGTPVVEFSEISHQPSDGVPGPRKTTSISGATLIQELMRFGQQDHLIEVVGIYPGTDSQGNEITLSGKVLLPKRGKPKRLILVSHYTVGSNAEAPSNCFSLEGILTKMGYGLIIPDYRGYGITADQVHPYLVMRETAKNVTDMYFAVREWLKAVDREPEKEEVNLMGYSQGGATTIAVEWLAETVYNNPNDSLYIPLHRVFAGGGPYDIRSSFERCVTSDYTDYPCSVPLVLQGMVVGHNLNIPMEAAMQKRLCDNLFNWVNSKRYTTDEINQFIGTHVTHELITPEAMNLESEQLRPLFEAMTANSLITYDWQPETPTFIMHSMDDETVPFLDAANLRDQWTNDNITYRFEHFGGHGMTCIQFISAVQNMLAMEEKTHSLP